MMLTFRKPQIAIVDLSMYDRLFVHYNDIKA